ncbi:MAG: trypsin-like peptidase domain-containing protein [Thermoleophilia bacterium]|nr:trypsin-like peptidase domain-containing protein [Thermoleophilia bacterium]
MAINKLALAAGAVVAGLLGGGLALGVGSAVWDGKTTTVVERVAAGTNEQAAAFNPAGDAETVGEIYRDSAPGVVQITSRIVVQSLFGEQRGQSLGSGFVIDKDGHIVTNYHVIEGADEVYVNFTRDDELKAKVVGVDPSTDLALLKIDEHRRALSPIPLGNSDAVRVGDEVVAIGNPFGLERTVTRGIVSALQRQIQAPNGFTIDKVIQTDAAINKGNSGGPLLDASGRVIGVNAQIESETGGNVGIGFAIPVNTVKKVVAELRERGRVEHAYLGVSMQPIDDRVAELFNLPKEGLLVAKVVPGSPADKAGLEGGKTEVVVEGESYVIGGDVVTKADGRAVASPDELSSVIAAKEPGDRIELEVVRGNDRKTVSVTLGRQPASTSD